MNGPSPAIQSGGIPTMTSRTCIPTAEEDAEDGKKLHNRQVAANVQRNEEDQRPMQRIHRRASGWAMAYNRPFGKFPHSQEPVNVFHPDKRHYGGDHRRQ